MTQSILSLLKAQYSYLSKNFPPMFGHMYTVLNLDEDNNPAACIIWGCVHLGKNELLLG
jgi:hypothetical protein